MALQATTEVLVATNKARHLVFFPGGLSSADDSVLCYNYKTNQWSSISAYDGIGMYSVNNKDRNIGLVRFSSGSVDLQEQLNTYVPQTATIETGATDPNKHGRTVVNGMRPLVTTDGTTTCMIGTQDLIDDSVTWVTGSAVNSRTGYSNMRAEGRYIRAKVSIASGFDSAIGADIDFAANGRV